MPRIAPYYQRDGITIYHGDMLDVLPALGGQPIIVTDPPYGIGYLHSPGGKGKHHRRNLQPIANDDVEFDPTIIMAFADHWLMFGPQHFYAELPKGLTWIAWDKSCGKGPADSFTDCDFMVTTEKTKRNVIRFLWKGIVCVEEGEEGGRRYHPSQKPIGLMTTVLKLFDAVPGTICDPYMGAGSTLIAAKVLRREAIGIELSEEYCEIAAKRLESHA